MPSLSQTLAKNDVNLSLLRYICHLSREKSYINYYNFFVYDDQTVGYDG